MGVRLEHDWFPAPLPDNVVLGERNWLYSSFAFRHYCSRRPVGVRTGDDTGLYPGTFFDLGPQGEVTIGRFCTLVGAIICSNGCVVIGDYVFIAHEVVLADSFAATPYDCPQGRNPEAAVVSAARPIAGRACEPTAPRRTAIYIGENVWIGARAILLGGARIGEGAIVGAATVVDFEVPPYSLVAGNPARIVRRPDTQ
jgi:acetyltransferase-like isoleucine patch superfamily enzyme